MVTLRSAVAPELSSGLRPENSDVLLPESVAVAVMMWSATTETGKVAEKLDGKRVIVKGELERRTGVEIKQRWIVTVTSLKVAG